MTFEKMVENLGKAELLKKISYWVNLFWGLSKTKNGKNQKGGFFGIILEDAKGGLKTVGQWPIGELIPKKVWKYIKFAMANKPQMLINHPKHELSWESRTDNPDDGQWGGAIRVVLDDGSKIILSFSGLTEAGDFVVCAMAAMELGILTKEKAQKMAKVCEATALFDYYMKYYHG